MVTSVRRLVNLLTEWQQLEQAGRASIAASRAQAQKLFNCLMTNREGRPTPPELWTSVHETSAPDPTNPLTYARRRGIQAQCHALLDILEVTVRGGSARQIRACLRAIEAIDAQESPPEILDSIENAPHAEAPGGGSPIGAGMTALHAGVGHLNASFDQQMAAADAELDQALDLARQLLLQLEPPDPE